MPAVLQDDPIDPKLKTVRGIIGARTALSGGSGSVAEFAAAAKSAKLDFLIFLEDFSAFAHNKSAFEAMISECEAHSDASLLLLPGYRIKNNLARGAYANARGNDMMVFGPKLVLPPPTALTADGSQILLMEFEPNSTTNYTGNNGFSCECTRRPSRCRLAVRRPTLPPVTTSAIVAADNWLLDATHQPDGVHYPWTAGYFNLNSRTGAGGMAMPDLRDEGAAAVRYHAADGTEQDLLDDFLLTAESTIGSVPVAVSEVLSPAGIAAAASTHALTYLREENVSTIFSGGPVGDGGLHWNSQYSGTGVFVSDGPLIDTWSTPPHPTNTNTNERRVMSLGAPTLVAGREGPSGLTTGRSAR